jgi:two-component system, LuxR family, sensor kinase FixL
MRYASHASELVAYRSLDGLEDKSSRFPRSISKKSERDLFGPDPYFEHSALALAFVSRDGKFLVKVNQAFARLHGASPENLSNIPVEFLVASGDHSLFSPTIRDNHLCGHFTYEIKHRRLNAGTFDAQVDVTVVRNEANKVTYRTMYVRDITDHKLTKGRRRQSQIELQDLQDWYVATQTTVALAHDLNQPLNAVCSYNEAALRMLNSGNPYPDKLRHALTASVQQSERAGKVMRDLLAFLTKGHAPLRKDSIDINAVVRQALVDMEEEARTDAITLVQQLGSDLGVAFAHRLHIEKVLGNLLRNSVEAIRASHNDRGTITVQTSRQNEFVLVTVRDTGPGFSSEQSAKILEPFYTSKDRGVGMGLPVSRALIEAHGGKLWAESGSGAVFRFTVPLAR